MLLHGALLAAGCTAAPEPPPEPVEVASLAQAYASPSANLEPAVMGSVLDRTLPTRIVLEALSGLGFVRDVVRDATEATSETTDLELDVQGSVLARSACPGWAAEGAESESERGYIEVTIGVQDSRVQRAFAGRATKCKFVTVRSDGLRSNIVATMDLQIDLGRELALRDPPPALLLRATNASGAIDGVPLALGAEVFSFRLGDEVSIETLVELAPLALGLSGTCLLGLQSDGAWALETQAGRWACGSAGSGPCVLVSQP